jgi:hypothetical protein
MVHPITQRVVQKRHQAEAQCISSYSLPTPYFILTTVAPLSRHLLRQPASLPAIVWNTEPPLPVLPPSSTAPPTFFSGDQSSCLVLSLAGPRAPPLPHQVGALAAQPCRRRGSLLRRTIRHCRLGAKRRLHGIGEHLMSRSRNQQWRRCPGSKHSLTF